MKSLLYRCVVKEQAASGRGEGDPRGGSGPGRGWDQPQQLMLNIVPSLTQTALHRLFGFVRMKLLAMIQVAP